MDICCLSISSPSRSTPPNNSPHNISAGGCQRLMDQRPALLIIYNVVLRARRETEDEMLEAAAILNSIGIFFLGVGALWFVSVYKDKQ